jgi:pimeloyl-ACP methyl ester carboxylesterase
MTQIAVVITLLITSAGLHSGPAAKPSSRPSLLPVSARVHANALSVQQKSRTPALRFNNVRLKTGVRLRYATQGKASGRPIIMLHGYPDSSFSYSRVLPLLSVNYRIYVLDQRGHGDSERPASGYGIPDLAADVLAFMDAKGLKQTIIVGHSMGSFVAQHVAAAAPERVTRLVLIGSATTLRNNVVVDLHQAVSALRDPVPEKFVREFQQSTVFQPVPSKFMDRVVSESLKLPARVWQAVINGFLAPEANARLDKIKAPTLIVWGDKDAIFPRSEQDGLVSAIPTAVLKVYLETGHDPHWERPEQFVKDLDGFLKQDKQR